LVTVKDIGSNQQTEILFFWPRLWLSRLTTITARPRRQERGMVAVPLNLNHATHITG
jgi:hypothetical protein